MYKVMVIGSCVSRDIFNLSDNGFEIVDYYSRTSFGSSMCERPASYVCSSSPSSKFQQRMLENDMNKTLTKDLIKHASSVDYILVDFIDERFSLYEFSDGTVCTWSSALTASGFAPEVGDGRLVKSGTPEFVDRWEVGWNKFMRLIKECGCESKIVINQAFWALRLSDGSNYDPPHTIERIVSVNKFLHSLYEKTGTKSTSERVISYPEEVLLGSTNHRWGLAPFHYVEKYYRYALQQLAGC